MFSSVVASAIERDDDVVARCRSWADAWDDHEEEETHGHTSITLASDAAAAATNAGCESAGWNQQDGTAAADTNQQDGAAAAEKSGWYGNTPVWADNRFKNEAPANDAANPPSASEMRALGEALRKAEKTDFRGNMRMSASRMSFDARQRAQYFPHVPTMTRAESDAVGRLITMFFYAMRPIMQTMGPDLPRRAQCQQEPGAWLRLGSSK